MKTIEEYMLLSLLERQSHINLKEPCIERGCQSYHLKGLLAHILDTTVPSGRNTIMVCHACHNGKCANPNHIYWGNSKENSLDAIANGKKSIWQCMLIKYGEEEARKILAKPSPRRISNWKNLNTK